MGTLGRIYNKVPHLSAVIIVTAVAFVVAGIIALPSRVAAACAAQDTSRGAVTSTFSVATAGTYRVWSRIKAPDTTNNSYILEIDGTTCGVVVGDSPTTANTWNWVDYQSATSTNKINVQLSAGTHTLTLIGREDNVELDRIILTVDTTCVPLNTGDNCANPPDTIAPTAPTSLTGKAASATQIDLAWTAATDDTGVTGYTIYRNGAQLTTVGAVTAYSDKSASGSSNYSYYVKALDAAGNQSANSNTVSVTTPAAVDTTPPSAPTSLSASSVAYNAVALNWGAATDLVGINSYTIYRNNVALVSVSGTTTLYNDTTVAGSTAYSYYVVAKDAAGNTSANSNTITVNTPTAPDTQAPTLPTGLTSPSQTTNSVSLTWAASKDNIAVAGYKVYRNGALVSTVTNTGATDSGLSSSTSYAYTVSAFDSANNDSGQSSPVYLATTSQAPDTAAPSVPTGVSAKASSATQVAVTWAPSSDNVAVTGYYVLRNGVVVGQVSGTTYTDTAVNPNTTYSYTVEAFDAAKNISAQSAGVNVSTPALADSVAPSAVSNLTTTISSQAQVNISWTAATDNVGVSSYVVSRNGTKLATVTTTSFGDATVSAGKSYSYSVIAYDAAGNASPATAQSATVPSSWYAPVNGVTGTYFNNATLSGLGTTRTDSNINFNWGSGSPMSGINSDSFSVRWIGRIEIPTTGTYNFCTVSNDGVRLWVNGQQLINNWTVHSDTTNCASVTLSAARYDFKMEYYENKNTSVAKLLWSGPGIAQSVIPNSRLFTNSYGLVGTYYSNASLAAPAKLQRIDSPINFVWGASAPDSQLPADNYSVRWAGYLYTNTAGLYTIYTESDDGIRVTLNGTQVINNWTDHSTTENSAQLYMNAGLGYPIQIDYYEHAGTATAQVQWSGPSLTKQIIPSGNLRSK